jgi:hypothetical protein
MRLKRLPAIMLGVVVLLAVSTALLQAGKKPTPKIPIPMTAVFADNEGDRITSDGLGAYADGVEGVMAVIDASGNFDMRVSEPRTLTLDFGTPASPDADAPFETGSEAGYISTGCGGFEDMAVGESVGSRLAVNFTYGGQQWFVRFEPAQYPDTTNVVVTRTSDDTWEIEAGPNDIAKLLSWPLKGRPKTTEHGNFHLPFKLAVTKQ